MKKIIMFSSVIALAMGVASIAAANSNYLTEFNTAYGTIAGNLVQLQCLPYHHPGSEQLWH